MSPAVIFLENGTIQGYRHKNERRWRFGPSGVELMREDGVVTSVLTASSGDGDVFRGSSLLSPEVQITLERTSWEARPRPRTLTRKLLADDAAKFGWEIGDHSYGNPTVHEKRGHLSIGKFVSIAEGVRIALGNHRMDMVSTYPFSTMPRLWPASYGFEDHDISFVRIGNDVWLGAGSMIMPGVTVHDGAVVAAGAVVTRDVPPYTVVAGIPAKVRRERFDSDIVRRLQRSRWWDWPDGRINEMMPLMMADVRIFLEAIERD